MTISLPMASDGGNRVNSAGLPGGKVRMAAIFAVLVALSACTGSQQAAGAPSAATQPNPVAQEQVEGTVHVCSSCHGFGGRSVSPTFPRLAGQQKNYLATELKAFRDKTRADPHAQTYMWGMAAHLSDPMIEAIAAYYSSQPPVAGEPGTSPEIAAGAKIFAEGLPAAGTPPCMGCHGAKAEGGDQGTAPRLAGQHRAYLARQLEAFASNARANEIMHENSKHLTPEQISAVTAFLATQ